MSQSVDSERASIDQFIETYVCWREACHGVWTAYERWLRAPRRDRRLAAAAYDAALEREARAAVDHADVQERLGRQTQRQG
jgi:hypothetical protein